MRRVEAEQGAGKKSKAPATVGGRYGCMYSGFAITDRLTPGSYAT
jgi:hypothetical protein